MDFKKAVLEHFQLNNESYNEMIKPLLDLDYGQNDHFEDMEKACNIIFKAIKNNEKIMIYGDYDADGIMATSILVMAFDQLKTHVGYYIPSRTLDGYGITLNRAKQIYEKGYKVLITVDNGVNQFEALSYLKEKGLKIVLTDHHTFDEVAPHDAFLHPFLLSRDKSRCGAYVAYMLAEALLGHRDDYLLSLASLATISDMMPMKGVNRNIVRLGLDYVNKDINHPFHLLCEGIINEESYGYIIAPRINAFGRMIKDYNVNKIVNLFINTPLNVKRQIALETNSLNNLRKEEIKKYLTLINIKENKVLIGFYDELNEGLIGLIAARLMQEKRKPCIVLGGLENGNYKGSARSFGDIHLDEFFKENKELFVNSGGHAYAGGLEINKDNIELLFSSFDNFASRFNVEYPRVSVIEIEKEDVNVENYKFLRTLSPFGQDFEEPTFSLKLFDKDIFFLNQHVKANLNSEASLIAFSFKDKLINEPYTFIGHFKNDTYHKGNVSFMVSDLILDTVKQ